MIKQITTLLPHKPTVLIPAKNFRFPYLDTDFNVIYRSINQSKPLEQQARSIIRGLKRKKITVDCVLGITNDRSAVVSAYIAKELNLHSPSLQSIYNCQNKAEFHKHLKKARLPFPETIIFNITKTKKSPLPFPIFIKPIKGSFSNNAYAIHSNTEFVKIIQKIIKKKNKTNDGYDKFFKKYDLSHVPHDNWYIAQPLIKAKQYTADAIVSHGRVQLLGVTQSIYFNNRKSFKRFDLPGDFPVKDWPRIANMLQLMVAQLQMDNTAFSVEFFLDRNDKISIIECNTRISLQFIPLYEKFLVESPLISCIKVALGIDPTIRQKIRKQKMSASSFALRVFEDQTIKKIPSKLQQLRLINKFELINLIITAKPGGKLSDQLQDAYSFRYGVVDIAGKNLREIIYKYDKFMKKPFVKMEPIIELE